MGISLSLMGREVACPVIISSSLGHMSTEKVLLLAANLSMSGGFKSDNTLGQTIPARSIHGSFKFYSILRIKRAPHLYLEERMEKRKIYIHNVTLLFL